MGKRFATLDDDKRIRATTEPLPNQIFIDFPEDFDFDRQQDWKWVEGELIHDPEPLPEPEEAVGHTTADMMRAALPLLRIQASAVYTDQQIMENVALFEEWVPGKHYPCNLVIQHEGIPYRIVPEEGVTAQTHQPPDAEGMLAVYRPIVKDAAGTADDPIPFVYGMDVRADAYYLYEDAVYLCKRDIPACVWYPGQPGVHDWEKAG